MLQSEAELTAVLHGTPLQGREVVRVEPPGPGYEAVLAVDVQGLDLFQAWQVLREKVGQTGRWPVLTVFWVGIGDSLRERLDTGDLFSRFYYLEEASAGRAGDTPADILKAALRVDVRASLAEMSQADEHANAMAGLRPVDVMRSELEMTQYLCGMAPEIEDVEQFVAQHGLSRQRDIEAWLLRWEQAHCPTEAVAGFAEKKGHQEWFEPEGHVYATLLLMPFTEGEATLAYMNWYASERSNSQFLVALLRSWREKYGAELVAHYGTMLQFVVARPPTTIEDAFALAQEHALAAPCTLSLPGVSLRHHARALLQLDRWFLHERP